MKRNAYNSVNIPVNKDSLYNAVIHSLQEVFGSDIFSKSYPNSATEIRVAISRSATDKALKDRIVKGEWGLSEEIQLIANLYKLCIFLWKDGEVGPKGESNNWYVYQSSPTDVCKRIYLAFDSSKHENYITSLSTNALRSNLNK